MSASILSIDAVMAAMADYAEASAEHGAALSSYDGYSWDWHGASYIAAVNNAKERAEHVLEQYIEQMVQVALEKRASQS